MLQSDVGHKMTDAGATENVAGGRPVQILLADGIIKPNWDVGQSSVFSS